ncbi:hypothetical protein B0J14DRAFT_675226 [Halenospora varia]|nr:hypothetical protein B0J14DRAFT_675226 [Halenospora varia]
MLFSINGNTPIILNRTQAIGIASACYGSGGILSPILGYVILHHSLEMAANTFNALCGPPEFVEIRVLLGSGIESVGATLSLILANYAISVNTDDTRSLISLQPTGSTGPSVGRPFTEIPRHIFPVIFTPLALAVLSSFFATGALASLRDFIGSVLLTAIYTIGTFFFAFLCFLIPPRHILFWAHACGIIFGVLIVRVQFHSVTSVQVLTLVVSIFQRPIPSMSNAIALRSLGQWTKLACYLTLGAASLGTSVWPWVTLAVARSHMRGVSIFL